MATIFHDPFNLVTGKWSLINATQTVSGGKMTLAKVGSSPWSSFPGARITIPEALAGDFYAETSFTSGSESFAQFGLRLATADLSKWIFAGHQEGNGQGIYDSYIVIDENGDQKSVHYLYTGKLTLGIHRIGTTINVYMNGTLFHTMTQTSRTYTYLYLTCGGYDNLGVSSNLQYDYVFVNNNSDTKLITDTYLIKDTLSGNFISHANAAYNTTTRNYNIMAVAADDLKATLTSGPQLASLFSNVTLGGETFKPYDKIKSIVGNKISIFRLKPKQ